MGPTSTLSLLASAEATRNMLAHVEGSNYSCDESQVFVQPANGAVRVVCTDSITIEPWSVIVITTDLKYQRFMGPRSPEALHVIVRSDKLVTYIDLAKSLKVGLITFTVRNASPYVKRISAGDDIAIACPRRLTASSSVAEGLNSWDTDSQSSASSIA